MERENVVSQQVANTTDQTQTGENREQTLLARIAALEAENAALKARLAHEPTEEQKAAERQRAKEQEQQYGIKYDYLPDGVYAGKPIITTTQLSEKEITVFTSSSQGRFVRNKTIHGLTLAGKAVLDPQGLDDLMQHQYQRVEQAQQTNMGNAAPGPRKKPKP